MSMHDPISDMLTRIRNGQMRSKVNVTLPASKVKKAIANVLKDEGYIDGFSIDENNGNPLLNIELKYYAGEPVIENIQREDLNAIDEALGIRRLTDEFKMTHESVAKILGKSRSAVTNLLRLLSLPSMVQQLLREKKLEMGHARSLLAAQESRQGDLAKRIVALNLTVRESESLVASVNKKTSDPRKNKSNADTDTMNLEDQLGQKLGMSVKIKNTKAGSGKVILSYRNLDDLDVLLGKLRA